MLTMINRLVRLLPAAICFILIACSKINQANFDRVQTGMSMTQVVNILGEPSSVDSINIAGISGTAATWKNQDIVITIQFLNDHAQIKTMNKVGEDPEG